LVSRREVGFAARRERLPVDEVGGGAGHGRRLRERGRREGGAGEGERGEQGAVHGEGLLVSKCSGAAPAALRCAKLARSAARRQRANARNGGQSGATPNHRAAASACSSSTTFPATPA